MVIPEVMGKEDRHVAPTLPWTPWGHQDVPAWVALEHCAQGDGGTGSPALGVTQVLGGWCTHTGMGYRGMLVCAICMVCMSAQRQTSLKGGREYTAGA